ncbi:MAG: RNA polymerase sigma factor [Ostreibacterium sp.]
MPLSNDPNELLLQVSLSNRQAFKKLYDLISAKLFAVSLRITKQESLSEEVLQDSFMKVWDNAYCFDPQRAQAITWIGTIVRNKSIDMIRKNSKYQHYTEYHDDSIEYPDGQDTPEQLAMTYFDIKAVNLCLELLNDKQKEVILMAYLEGYTHQQISEIKALPIGSVKTWLHRGIDKLKRCLNDTQRGQYDQ